MEFSAHPLLLVVFVFAVLIGASMLFRHNRQQPVPIRTMDPHRAETLSRITPHVPRPEAASYPPPGGTPDPDRRHHRRVQLGIRHHGRQPGH